MPSRMATKSGIMLKSKNRRYGRAGHSNTYIRGHLMELWMYEMPVPFFTGFHTFWFRDDKVHVQSNNICFWRTRLYT